jgi:hypothetical protein
MDVCFSGETDIKNRSRDVCSWPILLKKSEYCLDPIFSVPQVRVSDADVGEVIIHV